MSAIGPYRVLGPLGVGGSGEVLLLEHRHLGVRRAGKVLADSPRVLSEARIQLQLRHPNIVAAHELLEDGDRWVLVLEHIDGPSLETLLELSTPDPAAGLALFRGILAGVQAAHAAGVVHRDLKPSNVLLDTSTSPPTPKVADFGIARRMGAPRMTEQGEFLGTVGHAAPEQLEGRDVGFTADVYALGLLLYRLVCGRHPFDQVPPSELLGAMRTRAYDPPTGLPDDVQTLLHAALEPDPERRPADANALAALVSPVSVSPPRPSRAGWVVAAVAALVAGGLAWERSNLEDRLDAAHLAAVVGASEPQNLALALARGETPEGRVLAGYRARANALVLPSDTEVLSVRFAGDWLVAVQDDGVVRLHDLADGTEVSRFDSGIAMPSYIRADPLGRWLVLRADTRRGRQDSTAVARRLPDGQPLLSVSGVPRFMVSSDDASVVGLALEREGQQLVEVRRVETGELVWTRETTGHRLVLDGEGALLNEDGQWLRLDPDGQRVDGGQHEALGLLPDGRLILRDGQGAVYAQSGQGLLPLGGPEGWLHSRVVGRYFAARNRSAASLFDTRDGRRWEASSAVVFEPGDPVVLGYRDGVVRGWNEGLLPVRIDLEGRVLSLHWDAERGIAVSALDGGLAVLPHDPAIVERRGVVPEGKLGRFGVSWVEGDKLWTHGTFGTATVQTDGPVWGWTPGGLMLGPKGVGVGTWVPLPPGVPYRTGPVQTQGLVAVAASNELAVVGDGLAVHTVGLEQITGLGAGDGRLVAAHGTGTGALVSEVNGAGEVVQTFGTGGVDISSVSSLQVDERGVYATTWSGHVLVWRDATTPLTLGPSDRPMTDLAVAGDLVVAGGWEGVLHAWRDDQAAFTVPIGAQITDLSWSAEHQLLAVGDILGLMTLVDPDGAVVAQVQAGDNALQVGWWEGQPMSLTIDGVWTLWSLDAMTAPHPGSLTNLRVCPDTFEIVPVVPFPSPETRWAPPESCP